ncbi:hypothetical protein ABZ330_15115 [Streptomyces sp. NPDC006172]|uniref:hypothetical protein n=1 Tax=Streptomyces sp. NPDC006172 TaxID=3154470 RepID=UPI0033E4E60D
MSSPTTSAAARTSGPHAESTHRTPLLDGQTPPAAAPVMFRAGCSDCRGRFELAAGALRLVLGASSRTTFYSFTCPDCGAAVRKPAGERIVELLTGGGVRTLRLHRP